MTRLGIKIDEVDLFKELGVTVSSREIGKPSKKPVIEEIPYSNHVLDFSELYGEEVFTERVLRYTLNLVGSYPSRQSCAMLETRLDNLLMGKNEIKLRDDLFPHYYFKVNVREGTSFRPILYTGELEVTFTAYPFKISEIKEGNQIWDTFNFDLDYDQKTTFSVKRTTFKPLSVGQTVTVGAWSTHYEGGERIPKKPLGDRFKITEVEFTDWSDSKRSYYLQGLNKWVVEQDIVEAQNGVTKINLYNNGLPSVVPTVTSNNPVSIIFDNKTFNIWKGVGLSEMFRLKHGDNIMELTGNKPTTIDFTFYKELI